MKKIVALICLISLAQLLLAQARESNEIAIETPKQNVGLGIGIDYGGFGGRFTYMAVEKFGIFAAVGYNLVGVGFNGGINYKFNPGKRVTPTLGAMYGCNGVIKVVDGNEESKTYYGPSFSFGVELKTRRVGNFWNFELLLPLRPSEFQDDIDNLKNNDYEITEPLPIAFSVGYHFGS